MEYYNEEQQAAVNLDVMNECNGLQSCNPEIKNSMLNIPVNKQNYDQFVFVQVACEQDKEMLDLKNSMGLAVSIVGLVILLTFRSTIQLYASFNKVNDKIFDSELITVGDYTVMGQISNDDWYNFK